MHVLVTGASGLVGQQLVKTLSKHDHKVYGLYHNHPSLVASYNGVEYYPCDLTRERELSTLLEQHKIYPEVIVHCAALTDVDQCEHDPARAYAANVIATRNVLRTSVRKTARLIYISTASVFSGQHGGYTEEDIPQPSNVYNLTKFLGEEIVLTHPQNLIVRANVLGIHPIRTKCKNLMEWLIAMIQQNNNIELFTDVRINPISNITLADILMMLLTYEGDQNILHVGSYNVISKATLGRVVIEYFQEYRGDVKEVSVDLSGLKATRPKEMWLDTKKIVKELNLELPSARQEVHRILSNANLSKLTQVKLA